MNQTFPVPLVVLATENGDEWLVYEDFYCIDPVLGKINVPVNTITDFGSIPPFARPFIDPVEGPYRKPYIIHDRNYTMQWFTQEQADDCLLRQMTYEDTFVNQGLPWYKKSWGVERRVVYYALRLMGHFVWNAHKEDKIKREALNGPDPKPAS